MTLSRRAASRRSRGRSWRWWLLIAALCLTPAAIAQDPPAELEVEVAGAQQVPCQSHEVVAGRSLAEADLCFTAPATAALELRLRSRTPEPLRSIVLHRQSSAGTTTTSRILRSTSDSTTWTHELPLPRAALGPKPTPEAPLARKPASLFRRSGPATGPFATGHHLIDLQAGSGDDLQRVVLGLTITSTGGKEPVQWPVAGGRARLVLGGCWQRSPDPVVELVLTDCDDPDYQVKAATVDHQGSLSLAQYVSNSTRAYQKIWFKVSEETSARAITLELEQVLAGESRAIQKHFLDLDDRFLIVTFYGPAGEQKRLRQRVGPRSQWLVAGGGAAEQAPARRPAQTTPAPGPHIEALVAPQAEAELFSGVILVAKRTPEEPSP